MFTLKYLNGHCFIERTQLKDIVSKLVEVEGQIQLKKREEKAIKSRGGKSLGSGGQERGAKEVGKLAWSTKAASTETKMEEWEEK